MMIKESNTRPVALVLFVIVCVAVGVILKVRATTVITVKTGDDLQGKINQANCSDTVLIDAGAVFQVSSDNGIVFSRQCAANPVTVTTTKAALLPASVAIADKANMARIETSGVGPAVTISGSGYRIIGLDFTTKANPQYTGILVNIQGSNNSLERNYIHSLEDGTDSIYASVKIGVFVGGPNTSLIGNRIANPGALIQGSSTFDNTAAVMNKTKQGLVMDRNFISAWFTPYFQGGGDLEGYETATIAAGGTLNQATFSNVNNLEVGDLVAIADDTAENHDTTHQGYHGPWFDVAKVTAISGNVVSYVPWAGNIGSKPDCTGDCGTPLRRAPLSPGEARWKGTNPSSWVTRNTFWINPVSAQQIYTQYGRVPKGWIESKAGELNTEGNDFTGWPATFALTQHNQVGAYGATSPWSKGWGVIRNNRVADVAMPNGKQFGSQIFGILGEDNNGTSVVGGPWLIENNLLAYGGWIGDLTGGQNITFRHNTFLNKVGWANGRLLNVNYVPIPGVSIENNIAYNNEYGISQQAGGSLPGAKIAGNVLVAETTSPYRPNCTNTYVGNFCPQSLELVSYQLPAGSPFKGKGTDGEDPGVNMAKLLAALGGAIPNPTPSPLPSPSPSPTPSPSPDASPSPAPEEGGRETMFVDWPSGKGERAALMERLKGWTCWPPVDGIVYCKRP